MTKSLCLSAVTLSLATAAYAKVPTSTDEARAVATAVPPGLAVPPPRVVPSIVTSTDEARTLASKQPAAQQRSAVAAPTRAVTSTDEARAAAPVRQQHHGGGG